MSGFENDVVFAKNADFTSADNQAASESNGLTLNGQLWIGSTALNAGGTHINVGTLTSPDSSVTVGYSGTNITLVTNGSMVPTTLTGNSGGAISPSAGNINTVGTGSITIAGAGSTLTTQLTGLTNHAIQIGAGTATLTQLGAGTTGQILQTNTGADPTWSTATYPSTTTISQILYSSANNTVTGLATANRAVLTTGTTGVPVLTALATDGQLIIGSTAGAPAAATLTAGTGITITNASSSITINASAAGLSWSVITADQTAAVNHGYFCNKAGLLTLTMPSTSAVGDMIAFVNINTAAGAKFLSANPGQLNLGNVAATANTGSLTSTALGDVVFLICSVANTTWYAFAVQGNITIA